MYFPVKGRALINVPKVFLNLQLLRWVTKYKYIGTILTDDLSDDFNMLRQRGICYARCNSLIRNFSSCSLNVKVKLFKTFCCIMYCCQIIITSIFYLAHNRESISMRCTIQISTQIQNKNKTYMQYYS